MKKLYSVLLALAVFLSLTVGRVAAKGGYLEFVEARNDRDGLVIIVFNIHGEPNLGSLRQGKVFFVGNDSEPFDLYCKVDEASEPGAPKILTCSTTRQVADHFVNIQLGEFYFYSIFIPPSGGVPVNVGGSSNNTPACYDVYDINEGQNGLFWFSFDTHCPDAVPNNGDVLFPFPNPWGGTSGYEFNSNGFDFCFIEPSVEIGYYVLCN